MEYLDVDMVSLVVHDASGPPGIDWALNNPLRTELLVLLNTYYHPIEGLVKPEAIATFSTPGVRRSVVRGAARLSSFGFTRGYQSQLRRFFYDKRQRDTMLPVLTYQALDTRRAFFALNDVLDQEVLARAQNVQLLSYYRGMVSIIFGREDPYLNMRVAGEFDRLFPNSSLHPIVEAAHFVQLDRPLKVAELIIDAAN